MAWFRQLDDIDLGDESTPAIKNQQADNLRPDIVQPSLSQSEALANAPDHDGELFQVPGVMKR